MEMSSRFFQEKNQSILEKTELRSILDVPKRKNHNICLFSRMQADRLKK